MGAITQYTKLHHTNADILALKAGNYLLLGGNYKNRIPAINKQLKIKRYQKSKLTSQ
ncbi:hypothetical protein FC77_GL001413 [Lactobacillus acetotolerans DSM 20749 = JCM 3825]|jgi:beta-N-acetylhexosaminidase|nr:hypothetical protein FC77_GL001413 [Lactobacillus acetotolerans DSM 20749 = JCM 3825]